MVAIFCLFATHRAREPSLGVGSGPKEIVEAMQSVCRPRAPLLRALQRLAAPFLTPVSERYRPIATVTDLMFQMKGKQCCMLGRHCSC